MNIIVKEESGDTIKFLVTGCSTALLNSLRRIMISEVETWAIEYVRVVTNTTVIPDEMIAHRLGLIPLILQEEPETDIAEFSFAETAGEEPVEWCSELLVSEDDYLLPAFDGIPIVKAAKGQKLEFTAIAKKGIGSTHAKWSPVSKCFVKEGSAGHTFTVRSVGAMDPRDIVKNAIKILQEKLVNSKTDHRMVDIKQK